MKNFRANELYIYVWSYDAVIRADAADRPYSGNTFLRIFIIINPQQSAFPDSRKPPKSHNPDLSQSQTNYPYKHKKRRFSQRAFFPKFSIGISFF